jgi:hypothetical protein
MTVLVLLGTVGARNNLREPGFSCAYGLVKDHGYWTCVYYGIGGLCCIQDLCLNWYKVIQTGCVVKGKWMFLGDEVT